MKHNKKITLLILGMFLITQLVGIYVASYYLNPGHSLPFGLDTPDLKTNSEYNLFFSQIVIAFIFAVLVLFLLSKFKAEIILKLWFLSVIVIALAISFKSFLPDFQYKFYLVLAISLAFALLKIFQRNIFLHNFTELLIYPGIASVFIPLLNVYTVMGFLVLISAYDIWAVWHSGIMQKMAKFQIEKLRVFTGFFVPYMSKAMRKKTKNWKKTLTKKELNKKKIKMNVAILGGGDVVFPIITAGVMLKTLGLYSAFFVIAGAILGLLYLFIISEKKKFYPAMPYITGGILLGILVSYLIAWV